MHFYSSSLLFSISLQWLKIDELLEQERQIRAIMSSRAGVVALMLHSTFDHEAMVSLSEAQQHGQPESGQVSADGGANIANSRHLSSMYNQAG